MFSSHRKSPYSFPAKLLRLWYLMQPPEAQHSIHPFLLFISVLNFSLLWNRFQVDLSKIDGNDPAPFAMIHNSGTIRTFQLESPTRGDMPKRLTLNHFEDFIVSTCLVRPSPLKLNMTRHGRKPATYLHHQLLGLLYLLNQTNRPYYISCLEPNK